MSEFANGEVAERARFNELQQRYEKLVAWAKDQTFVTVFRAEGPMDPNLQRTTIGQETSATQVGTWFSPSYDFVVKHYGPMVENSGNKARVFSLVVPQSLLDERDAIAKGMNEVNVLNRDLLEGKKEISSSEEALQPTIENYLHQFSFVREFDDLKRKFEIT